MRTFFYFVAFTFILAIAPICMGFGFIAYNISAISGEASAYAKSSVVAITSNWDAAAFLSRASPALTKATDAPHVKLVFDQFGALGPLVKSEACTGGTNVNYDLFKGRTIRSMFTCTAKFKNNTATVQIYLSKVDDRWVIDSFRVDTPLRAAKPILRKV